MFSADVTRSLLLCQLAFMFRWGKNDRESDEVSTSALWICKDPLETQQLIFSSELRAGYGLLFK